MRKNMFLGAPGFFRGRSTQTLHDSINKGFICMSANALHVVAREESNIYNQ